MTVAKRPGWFIILVAALLLWGLAGCASFGAFYAYGSAMNAHPTDWDRTYDAALPGWYLWVYAIAVISPLLGSIAMLARSKAALPLYALSLIAVVIQFGYAFLATDLLAHKGAAMTVPFPAFIAAMAIFQLWLANYARKRHWIA